MLKYLTSDRYVTFYRANTGYCRPVVCIQADFFIITRATASFISLQTFVMW